MVQLGTRRFVREQYALSDMARDTAGLIDALELEPVHAVGVSMGGMIAQTLAAQYPERVRSLVSMMSDHRRARRAARAPSTLRMMLSPVPRDEDGAIERS